MHETSQRVQRPFVDSKIHKLVSRLFFSRISYRQLTSRQGHLAYTLLSIQHRLRLRGAILNFGGLRPPRPIRNIVQVGA